MRPSSLQNLEVDTQVVAAERYRTLLEVNNAIITCLKQPELVHAVSEALKRVIPCDTSGLAIYEPELDDLRVFALEGMFSDQMPAVGQLCDRPGRISGHPWPFDKPVLRRDLEAERQYTFEHGLYALGLRSHCTLPLTVRGKAIGTLGVASFKKAQYSETNLEFLTEVTKQIAPAVANMRAYEEIRALSEQAAVQAERRRTLLEINNAIITSLTQTELLQAVYKALPRVISFDLAGITFHEPELDGLRFFALEGQFAAEQHTVGNLLDRKDSCFGEAFTYQRSVLRCDLATERVYSPDDYLFAEGMRSYCTVPLITQGQSIGAMSVASKIPHQYSETDAELLQEVANQVALAIANMQSYEEIKDLNAQAAATAERRRTLLEINNAIVTNLTQQDLCEAVFAALQRVVPFDQVGISLFDYEQDAYRIIAIGGRLRSDHFSVGSVISRQENWVTDQFSLTQPLLQPDLETVGRNAFEEQLYTEGIRSYCAAPLLVQNRVIGALSVTSKTRNQYSVTDVELLQEVANQVAIAIANMRAYEEIAALKARLQAENVYLQEEIRQEHNFEEIIGNSPALIEVLQKVERVAQTDSTVLILGETGTGKELIARAIHDRSARKGRPLVKVNCGAISAGLVESELFGHVKGAFTGAVDRRVGRFELANGGTLFLDEVGELPLETQVKLLRVLQEGEFEPVGSSKTVKVDVRIIAATNRNLEEAVREGRFRADLFYRLNVLPLQVPPLRERQSDIPQLAMFFLTRVARQFGKQMEGVSQETMGLLMNYSWPGNIRELQNIIERGVVLSEGPVLTLDQSLLPASPVRDRVAVHTITPPRGRKTAAPAAGQHPSQSPLSLKEAERRHILSALEQTGWIIEGANGAAKLLNLHPNTLRSRMKKLAIKRPTHE